MPVKFIIILILATLIAIFAAKNLEPVEVSFYDFSFNSHDVHIPLFLVVLASIAFGFMLAWVDGWVGKMKLRSIIRKSDKTIQSLKQELERSHKSQIPDKVSKNDS